MAAILDYLHRLLYCKLAQWKQLDTNDKQKENYMLNLKKCKNNSQKNFDP